MAYKYQRGKVYHYKEEKIFKKLVQHHMRESTSSYMMKHSHISYYMRRHLIYDFEPKVVSLNVKVLKGKSVENLPTCWTIRTHNSPIAGRSNTPAVRYR
jgi:hypothetical protein